MGSASQSIGEPTSVANLEQSLIFCLGGTIVSIKAQRPPAFYGNA